jgi:AraC-like DNA-binding protein
MPYDLILAALAGAAIAFVLCRLFSRRRTYRPAPVLLSPWPEEALLYRLMVDDVSDDAVLIDAARAYPVWNSADQWAVAFLSYPEDETVPLATWKAAYLAAGSNLNGRHGLRAHAYDPGYDAVLLVLAWRRGHPPSPDIPSFLLSTIQRNAGGGSTAVLRFGDVVERPVFLRVSRQSAEDQEALVQSLAADTGDPDGEYPETNAPAGIEGAEASPESAQPQDLSSRIMEYIRQNFKDSSLSRGMVAAKFSLSEDYLSTLIKNNSGQTFSVYLEGLRMQAARDLLTEGRLTVDEISEEVGYSGARVFRRAFKRITGVTPADSRNQDS